jgi:membrane protease YdiL (CAAX protease family)
MIAPSVRSPARPSAADDYRFLAFASAVVVVNNLIVHNLVNAWHEGGNRQPLFAGMAIPLMWAAIFWWTFRVERLRLWDIGMRRENLGTSAAWGLAVGCGMALLPMLFLVFPIILPRPVQLVAFAVPDTSMIPLAVALVALRNTTAVFEEILFRGLIQERGIRWLGPTGGIALSVGLFVVWHTVVTFHGVQETNLTGAAVPWPLLYLAASVPLGMAGVVFSLLRQRSGNLAAPTVAHWAVNSLMQGMLVVLSSA